LLYQKKNTAASTAEYAHLKSLFLDDEVHCLSHYCQCSSNIRYVGWTS